MTNSKYECAICGDKASKYNFGAISCNACRQFFKRIASKYCHQLPACKSSGSCDITAHSRKDCISCRYKKCLAQGMRSDRAVSKSWSTGSQSTSDGSTSSSSSSSSGPNLQPTFFGPGMAQLEPIFPETPKPEVRHNLLEMYCAAAASTQNAANATNDDEAMLYDLNDFNI
ncbi:Nuclear receptor subfamily 1 group I member 3 [Halotydeus destructor]|nr:Nuclear receptor subfamily 1 group I member 3 [Halotydeus destructor]